MMSYQATCSCGSVKIEIADKPSFINNCNCSLCEKIASIWGYFEIFDVGVSGATQTFIRPDKSVPVVELHSCTTCLVTTHWVVTKEYQALSGVSNRIGVNMRLFNDSDLAGVEMRFPDGKAWSGEGAFEYRKPSITLGGEL